jgi:hypothetical protein
LVARDPRSFKIPKQSAFETRPCGFLFRKLVTDKIEHRLKVPFAFKFVRGLVPQHLNKPGNTLL